MSISLRIGLSLVFSAFAIGVTNLWAEDEGQQIHWHTSAEQAWQEMRDHDRPLLLFVTTNGCRYCDKMKGDTYADDDVRTDVDGSFVALRINADNEATEQWLARFGIRLYPTTLLISPQSKLIDRIDGYVDAEKMRPRLARAVRQIEEVRTAAVDVNTTTK